VSDYSNVMNPFYAAGNPEGAMQNIAMQNMAQQKSNLALMAQQLQQQQANPQDGQPQMSPAMQQYAMMQNRVAQAQPTPENVQQAMQAQSPFYGLSMLQAYQQAQANISHTQSETTKNTTVPLTGPTLLQDSTGNPIAIINPDGSSVHQDKTTGQSYKMNPVQLNGGSSDGSQQQPQQPQSGLPLTPGGVQPGGNGLTVKQGYTGSYPANPFQKSMAESMGSETGSKLADSQDEYNVQASQLPLALKLFQNQRAAAADASFGYGVNNEGTGWVQQFHNQAGDKIGQANTYLLQGAKQDILNQLGPAIKAMGGKGNKIIDNLATAATGLDMTAAPQAKQGAIDRNEQQFVARIKSNAAILRQNGLSAPSDAQIDAEVLKQKAAVGAPLFYRDESGKPIKTKSMTMQQLQQAAKAAKVDMSVAMQHAQSQGIQVTQ